MKVVVGIGNVGSKYHNTAHNIGFLLLDTLAQPSEWKKQGNKYLYQKVTAC